MGNWFTKMYIEESTGNACKNTNYYFNKESITVIPTKFYNNTIKNNYPGYPWGVVVASGEFEESLVL